MRKDSNQNFIDEFTENLNNFSNIISKLEDKENLNEKELEEAMEAKNKVTTSLRAYFNDIGMQPNILQLLDPLLSGKVENADEANVKSVLKQFEKNLIAAIKNIKNDLENSSNEQLYEKYGVNNSEDIHALKNKIEVIKTNFIAKTKNNSNVKQLKEAAVFAAASLVGCLYGIAVSAMFIAAEAVIAVVATLTLVCSIPYGAYSGIKKGSLSHGAKIAANGVGIGVFGVSFATLFAALKPITIPRAMIDGCRYGVQYAKNNPNAGSLDRIFGCYKSIIKDARKIMEPVIKKISEDKSTKRRDL